MEGINRIPSLQRDCEADIILGDKTTGVSVSVVTAVEVETAEVSVANDDGSSIFQMSVLLCLATIGYRRLEPRDRRFTVARSIIILVSGGQERMLFYSFTVKLMLFPLQSQRESTVLQCLIIASQINQVSSGME